MIQNKDICTSMIVRFIKTERNVLNAVNIEIFVNYM